MIRLFHFLAILILISSCSKDEPAGMNDPMEMETETLLLLKETRLDGELIFTFEYNPDSMISKQVVHSNGSPSTSIAYTYIGTTIESVQTNLTTNTVAAIIKFSRINDNQGLKESFNQDGELSISNVYTFDNNPCGFETIDAIDSFGNPLTSTIAEYTDENCSSIYYAQYGDEDPYVQWEYTRNDKFEASNSTILPFFRIDKLRSVTRRIRKSQSGSVSTNLSYDAEIEYNEFDYPTKETRTFGDGDVQIFTYSYYN